MTPLLKKSTSSVSPPIFRTAESTSRAEGFIKAFVDIPLRDSDRIWLNYTPKNIRVLVVLSEIVPNQFWLLNLLLHLVLHTMNNQQPCSAFFIVPWCLFGLNMLNKILIYQFFLSQISNKQVLNRDLRQTGNPRLNPRIPVVSAFLPFSQIQLLWELAGWNEFWQH